MQRYKVGHGFSFYLDRSPLGSIWFDKGEWEALKSRQYHDELHLIFTAPWQDGVRTEERIRSERRILEERLGSDLLGQLEDIKSKLDVCEYRDMALAYLHC